MTIALRRLLRIVGIALGFAAVFLVSQHATLVRNGETAPGTSWALGALSVFFLVGALATELSQGPDADIRKDILWGLGLGGVLGIVARVASA